jgi:antitoxin component of MazEF toxin-antitoxin module
MSKKYESKVLEICDNGDAIIEIPPELMEEMGWEIGDVLDIVELQGRIIIINKSKEVK